MKDKPVLNNNTEVCIDNLINICIATDVFKYTKKMHYHSHDYIFVVFHKVQLNTQCELDKACERTNFLKTRWNFYCIWFREHFCTRQQLEKSCEDTKSTGTY